MERKKKNSPLVEYREIDIASIHIHVSAVEGVENPFRVDQAAGSETCVVAPIQNRGLGMPHSTLTPPLS